MVSGSGPVQQQTLTASCQLQIPRETEVAWLQSPDQTIINERVGAPQSHMKANSNYI